MQHLIWGNIYVHQAIFISIVYFESANLLLMLVCDQLTLFYCQIHFQVCGTITYLHIARYTHSKKLRQVNNRLLRIRIMQVAGSFVKMIFFLEYDQTMSHRFFKIFLY